jgi:hypothetical protein
MALSKQAEKQTEDSGEVEPATASETGKQTKVEKYI